MDGHTTFSLAAGAPLFAVWSKGVWITFLLLLSVSISSILPFQFLLFYVSIIAYMPVYPRVSAEAICPFKPRGFLVNKFHASQKPRMFQGKNEPGRQQASEKSALRDGTLSHAGGPDARRRPTFARYNATPPRIFAPGAPPVRSLGIRRHPGKTKARAPG